MATSLQQARAIVDSFDWDKWTSRVESDIKPGYRAILIEQGEREADRYGWTFDDKDPFLDDEFLGDVAERVVDITDTTRERLANTLRDSFDSGKTMQEIAGDIRSLVDAYVFSPARALNIARTETGFAYNSGALLSYDQNGIERVDVSDGDGDEDCADADGAIWTLDKAWDNLLGHPGCVRAFGPHVEDERSRASDDD